MRILIAAIVSILVAACTATQVNQPAAASARVGVLSDYVQPSMVGGRVIFRGPNHVLEVDPSGARITRYALDGQNILNETGGLHATGAVVWLAPQSAWPNRWPPPDALTHTRYYDVHLETTTAAQIGTHTDRPIPPS